MSTTNQGLAKLQNDVAALKTANDQLIADVATLLANQQPGLKPGQVIVLQADIDALDTTVAAAQAADVASDAAVPKPLAVSPASLSLSLAGSKTGQLVISGGKAPISLASADKTIATVDATGVVTGVAVGATSVTASDSSTPSKSVSVSVAVTA